MTPSIHIIENNNEKKNTFPTVTIMGATHGNERVGVEVLHFLKKYCHSENISGTLQLVLGNTYAYEKNVRFIEYDLNRLFGITKLQELSAKQNLSPEEKRALELSRYLEKTDFLLDIHSTINPSEPFVFCKNTQKHLEIAKIFQTNFIVSNAKNPPKEMLLCTDNYVDSFGGIGITYESGWHKEKNSFADVLKKTLQFLRYTQTISKDFFETLLHKIETNEVQKKYKYSHHLLFYDKIFAQTDSFVWITKPQNFQFFPKGSLLAIDGETQIYALEDLYTLFVKNDIQKNAVACYLAKT